MCQKYFYGLFSPSCTVQYIIISVSIVRSCEWYQNSEPYRTTFWYPSIAVPSTARGTKRVELNSLQNIDWLTRIVTFAWYKRIKLLLHSFRSAVHECWAYLHQSAQTQKNIIVYFIIYIFTQTIAISQYAFLSVLVDLWKVIAQKPA